MVSLFTIVLIVLAAILAPMGRAIPGPRSWRPSPEHRTAESKLQSPVWNR